MNTVVIKDKVLRCLLDAIDVDEREHKDRVGAVGEFSDSWVSERVRLR